MLAGKPRQTTTGMGVSQSGFITDVASQFSNDIQLIPVVIIYQSYYLIIFDYMFYIVSWTFRHYDSHLFTISKWSNFLHLSWKDQGHASVEKESAKASKELQVAGQIYVYISSVFARNHYVRFEFNLTCLTARETISCSRIWNYAVIWYTML